MIWVLQTVCLFQKQKKGPLKKFYERNLRCPFISSSSSAGTSFSTPSHANPFKPFQQQHTGHVFITHSQCRWPASPWRRFFVRGWALSGSLGFLSVFRVCCALLHELLLVLGLVHSALASLSRNNGQSWVVSTPSSVKVDHGSKRLLLEVSACTHVSSNLVFWIMPPPCGYEVKMFSVAWVSHGLCVMSMNNSLSLNLTPFALQTSSAAPGERSRHAFWREWGHWAHCGSVAPQRGRCPNHCQSCPSIQCPSNKQCHHQNYHSSRGWGSQVRGRLFKCFVLFLHPFPLLLLVLIFSHKHTHTHTNIFIHTYICSFSRIDTPNSVTEESQGTIILDFRYMDRIALVGGHLKSEDDLRKIFNCQDKSTPNSLTHSNKRMMRDYLWQIDAGKKRRKKKKQTS